EHQTAVGIGEPQEKIGDGRLAAAADTDDRDNLPRLHGEREIPQDRAGTGGTGRARRARRPPRSTDTWRNSMAPFGSGSRTGCLGSTTSGGLASHSGTRTSETQTAPRLAHIVIRPWAGCIRRIWYVMNAMNVPSDSVPATTSRPPMINTAVCPIDQASAGTPPAKYDHSCLRINAPTK